MDNNSLPGEGDMNFSEERRNWDEMIHDPLTRELLNEDARYFLHQSMSTPSLDVLSECKGSSMITFSGRYLFDFHGNNVHQIGQINTCRCIYKFI
jgi:4-aminobutyrate aminotransferase